MDRTGKKCVLYSRVSTEMQVDGFSLAGQKTCLLRFAEREEMKIVGEYEDAGKSGKTIEGRPAFKKMLEDIKDGLQVDYIIVYKLSRFGRNAADVLNSLELIQDYGINLICTDEGIDSSQASGRLLISVLSAVAQIERENILEQTMNGRKEKARQGLWNGGQAPYGYELQDGALVVNEEEANNVRLIFEKYANTTMSLAELTDYCNNQGIKKDKYGNRIEDYWTRTGVGRMLNNSIYLGKIEWGRRKNIKVKGTKEYKRIDTKKALITAEGKHDPIITEELFNKCMDKRIKVQQKHNVNVPRTRIHVLSGLLVCPHCGEKMKLEVSRWITKSGEIHRKDFYVCSKYKLGNGECTHNKYYSDKACQELIKNAISVVINNGQFISDLRKEFLSDNQESMIQLELSNYKKKLKDKNKNSATLEIEIDNLDADNINYEKRREILNNRLNKIYDEIFELEEKIQESENKLKSYSDDLISADYIINLLKNFGNLYDEIDAKDKKELLKALIKKVCLNELDNNNFSYSLKSIEFNFPVFKSDIIKSKNIEDQIKLMPTKEVINEISQIVEFGDQEGQIHLAPYYFPNNMIEKVKEENKIKTETSFSKKEKTTVNSHKSENQLSKYVKEKYNLYVYGNIIRAFKYEVGIPLRRRVKGISSFDNVTISIEKFDAIAEAIKTLKLYPEDFEDTYDSKVKKARKRLMEILKCNKTNNSLYDKIMRDIKIESNERVTIGNISNIETMLKKGDQVKRYRNLPSIDNAKLIAKKLLEYGISPTIDYINQIEHVYLEQEKTTKKKKRYTNSDIINYAREKYEQKVCASMISYVRDKLGICIKSKDWRYDATQKNKRIPNDAQFNAIEAAMKEFKMIA